jgi:type I restriction enzyme, S subunit
MKTPSNWRLWKLQEVTAESQKRATSVNKANLSVFGVSNQMGLTTTTRYHAANLERYKIIEPGMFAYNPMRLNIGSIGYCSDEFGIGLVSPDYVVFCCNKKYLEPKFLYYCIQSLSLPG